LKAKKKTSRKASKKASEKVTEEVREEVTEKPELKEAGPLKCVILTCMLNGTTLGPDMGNTTLNKGDQIIVREDMHARIVNQYHPRFVVHSKATSPRLSGGWWAQVVPEATAKVGRTSDRSMGTSSGNAKG